MPNSVCCLSVRKFLNLSEALIPGMHGAAIPLRPVAIQAALREVQAGWLEAMPGTNSRPNSCYPAIAPGMRVCPRAWSVPLVAGLPRFVPGKR